MVERIERNNQQTTKNKRFEKRERNNLITCNFFCTMMFLHRHEHESLNKYYENSFERVRDEHYGE